MKRKFKKMRSAVCGILALAVAASYTCAAGAAEGTALAGDVNGDDIISTADAVTMISPNYSPSIRMP